VIALFCLCLCSFIHPDQKGVCNPMDAMIVRRVTVPLSRKSPSPKITRDMPLCMACAQAIGVAGQDASEPKVGDELDLQLRGKIMYIGGSPLQAQINLEGATGDEDGYSWMSLEALVKAASSAKERLEGPSGGVI
jgi:hypothetical protein